MIRAEERSLLRPRIRRDTQAHLVRHCLNYSLQCRTLSTEGNEILSWTKHVHRIEINVCRGLLDRHDGMLRIPLGAEQSLLFRSREQKQARAFRTLRWWRSSNRLRNREHDRN